MGIGVYECLAEASDESVVAFGDEDDVFLGVWVGTLMYLR